MLRPTDRCDSARRLRRGGGGHRSSVCGDSDSGRGKGGGSHGDLAGNMGISTMKMGNQHEPTIFY